MKNIKELRQEINEIDQQMASLFEKRMQVSKDVAMYKKENVLPITDEKREQEVIKRNAEYISDDVLKKYYIDYQKSVMNISKRYQSYLLEGMKVAYCGVEGAFAYIAAKRVFPNASYIAYPNFTSAYQAVENGECDTCVLPIENSYAGDVGNVMDLVFSGSLYINRIYNLDISHNLLVKKGTKLEDIKKVISHPQALEQCRVYIQKNNFEVEECANTAMSAKQLVESDDNSVAAIASIETAELYGLEVLEKNINTSKNNTTRFAVFSKVINKPAKEKKMGEHFILVFTVLNEAGALAKTLNIIGYHGYNMRNLRSRPMKSLMWNYYFFVELEGNINTQDGANMLKELGSFTDSLKLVGTYYDHNEE